MPDLLELTDAGLYCRPGRLLHRPLAAGARAPSSRTPTPTTPGRGSAHYLAAREGEPVLRTRLGADAVIDTPATTARRVEHNGVRISLAPRRAHPRLGPGAPRIPRRGLGRLAATTRPSPTPPAPPSSRCAATCSSPNRPSACRSTAGRPRRTSSPTSTPGGGPTQAAGKASLLYGYALGKSQRLLAGLDPDIGPIYLHGALVKLTRNYREAGVRLPPTTYTAEAPKGTRWNRGIILAPPSAHGSAVDAQVRPVVGGLRQRLDAHPRHAPPQGGRSRLRPVRPRRLGRAARRHPRHRREPGLGHARLRRRPRPPPARARHRRPAGRDAIRGRARRRRDGGPTGGGAA